MNRKLMRLLAEKTRYMYCFDSPILAKMHSLRAEDHHPPQWIVASPESDSECISVSYSLHVTFCTTMSARNVEGTARFSYFPNMVLGKLSRIPIDEEGRTKDDSLSYVSPHSIHYS